LVTANIEASIDDAAQEEPIYIKGLEHPEDKKTPNNKER